MFYIYSLLTAPGVMVHELGHAIFCVLSGVKIHKIKLFQFNKKIAGYVTHDEPNNLFQALFISLGPLIINSLVSLLLFSQISHNYSTWIIGLKTGNDLSIIWLWLGIAVGLHSIPSNGDAQTLFQISSHRWWANPLKLIGLPFVGAIYILNILKRLHIHFIFTAILFWFGNIYLKK